MSDGRLRVGAVGFLNTRPLVYGLARGLGAERIDLRYDVPSLLADRMREGSLDIALLPVIELARMPELEVVPGLAIGTLGPARSVLLSCDRPIERLRSVAPDAESRTSNALAAVLLSRWWGREVRFTGPTEAADGQVRIGDKALFEIRDEGRRIYDLAGAWTEWTGAPFVFAVWAARPGLVDRDVYRLLHESRRRGSRALDEIARDYRWQGRPAESVARPYLGESIRYRLGSAEVGGMKRFFREAVACGLIDREPEIRMALERWSVCHEAAARAAAPPCGR